jgi:hypothetical protein
MILAESGYLWAAAIGRKLPFSIASARPEAASVC